MVSPVQIVLNPENFEEARKPATGSSRKDFYANRDREFRAHKAALTSQIDAAAGVLSAQSSGRIGFLKVILRRDAWAKSHRPLNTLFRGDRTPLVGGGDLGVMIVEATPASLAQVKGELAKAETHTDMRFDPYKQKEVPNPSAQKSEAGAIDQIQLYGPSDRRSFSLEDAIMWLSNPMTGGSYQVELFTATPPRAEWDRLDEPHRLLIESFLKGFNALEYGVSVERIASRNKQPLLAVRLNESSDRPLLKLDDARASDRRRDLPKFDPDRERHARLLTFLDHHPLVRRIELPGIVVRSNEVLNPPRVRPATFALPPRDTRRSHPKIGIIDGGVGAALSDWVIDRWDILAEEDMSLDHGTFIGGLATAGGALNGTQICCEADGAELVDIAIFPNEKKAGAFASYYPDGLPQFFDEMDNAVADARARHGVRVFNMSLNVLQPAAADRYSTHATRLDRIAESNNAVIFVSAGNVQPQDLRAEWPGDPTTALAALAAARNDGLLTPAESARNVTVGAVNPPDHGDCIATAPTRFTRRGPGLRSGVKPELAHFGGSGTIHPTLGHGLFSVLPDGSIIDGCGTSYAAPLVAKTAAVLDHSIEGEVSRETLIALLVHHANIPEPLRLKEFAPIARHMVGFGMPVSAEQMLETGEHSITLVFASRISKGQQVSFGFAWPASLVTSDGKCRGRAKLTLVSTPPLDPRFGSEFVRVNINATLQQEQKKEGQWKGQLEPLYLPPKRHGPAVEAELIEHDLKWSPVKVMANHFPQGVGPTSNWRLFVDYLTRAGEVMPEEGVPFTAIVTISDDRGEKPVFNDMRQSLQSSGIRIADIRTAARITSRV